jgi:hypothetical protein
VEKEKNTGIATSTALFSWQAKQFENVPRSQRWYVLLFLMLVALLAYGLFTDNFLLGIIVILVGLVFYLFEKRESQTFTFAITSEGVQAHNRLYEFSSLEDFWIFYQPGGRKELSLKSSKKIMPYIHIPLGEADPSQVRGILLRFLPEVQHEESIVDSLERFI